MQDRSVRENMNRPLMFFMILLGKEVTDCKLAFPESLKSKLLIIVNYLFYMSVYYYYYYLIL